MTFTRSIAIAAVAAAAFIAAPASAGTLTYQNGQSTWEATGCTAPTAPAFMEPSASASGNALSANTEAYNQYSQAVQAFLVCVSNEANQDLAAIGQQINSQIGQVQNAWQQDLARKQAELPTKRGR